MIKIQSRRLLFSFLLIFISTLNLYAQLNEKDLKEQLKTSSGIDKVIALNQLSDILLFKSPQQSLTYGTEALKLAKKYNDKKNLGESYLSVAYALRYMGEYKAALDSLYITINFINEVNDKRLESQILNLIGLVHQDMGHDTLSLENYYKSFDIAEEIKDNYGMVTTLNNLGNFFMKNQNYQKAIEYFFKCLNIYEMAGNKQGIAQIYNNIGTVYQNQGDNNKALEYDLKAYEIIKKLPDYQIGLAYILNNLGVIYINLKDYEKATPYLLESISICKDLNLYEYLLANYNNLGIIYTEKGDYAKAIENLLEGLRLADKTKNIPSTTKYLLNIGDVYYKQGKYVKALSYFNRAMFYSEKQNDFYILSENNYGIYQVYKATGDYEKSLKYLEKYVDFHDSLDVIKNTKLVNEVEAKYELDIKEQRIITLQKDSKIKELEIEKEQTNNKILLLGLSALVFIITLITYLFLHRIKINKILQEQNRQINNQNEELNVINNKLVVSEKELKISNNTKDKFFSIIAHDLKNPLLGLKSLVFSFNNRGKLSEREIHLFSNQLNESLNSVIELLNNLLNWARSQKDELNYYEEKVNIIEIINHCIEENKKQSVAKKINLKNNLTESIQEIKTDKNMLDFILRNVISNAIKFTKFGGTVEICNTVNKYYSIQIKDSGMGISEENIEKLFNQGTFLSTHGTDNERGSGLGLVLCKEFITKMGGFIEVESKENIGSTFTIRIPLK